MDHQLSEIEFLPLKSDPCICVFKDDTGFVTLTLYVDDVLLLGASKQPLNKLKKQLMELFRCGGHGRRVEGARHERKP